MGLREGMLCTQVFIMEEQRWLPPLVVMWLIITKIHAGQMLKGRCEIRHTLTIKLFCTVLCASPPPPAWSHPPKTGKLAISCPCLYIQYDPFVFWCHKFEMESECGKKKMQGIWQQGSPSFRVGVEGLFYWLPCTLVKDFKLKHLKSGMLCGAVVPVPGRQRWTNSKFKANLGYIVS